MIFRSVLLAGMFCTAVLAQWPKYPTAGVPRTADGKPDLTAPTPRTADGHPDFTGNWDYYRERPAPPPVPTGASTGLGPVTPNTSPFFNIGVGLKDPIPFTPWAAELRKSRASANNKDNPDAHCLPIGLTQLHMHPQPRKFVQTPGLIVIIYESNGGLRQIFMDGRPLPKTIRSRGGTAIRWATGTATRWSSRPSASATMSGWMWKAALSPEPAR